MQQCSCTRCMLGACKIHGTCCLLLCTACLIPCHLVRPLGRQPSSSAHLGRSLEGVKHCVCCDRGSQRHHAARQQFAIHSHIGCLTQCLATRGQPQAPAASEHFVEDDRDASAAALLQQSKAQANQVKAHCIECTYMTVRKHAAHGGCVHCCCHDHNDAGVAQHQLQHPAPTGSCVCQVDTSRSAQ